MLRVLSLVYPFKSLILFFVLQAIMTQLPQLCMGEAMIIVADLGMGTMVIIMDQIMGTMAAIIDLGMGIMAATMVDTVGDTMEEIMAADIGVKTMAVDIGV